MNLKALEEKVEHDRREALQVSTALIERITRVEGTIGGHLEIFKKRDEQYDEMRKRFHAIENRMGNYEAEQKAANIIGADLVSRMKRFEGNGGMVGYDKRLDRLEIAEQRRIENEKRLWANWRWAIPVVVSLGALGLTMWRG